MVAPVGAQTNFYTLLTNGPASNRLNIVLFAEGYTTNELPGLFLSDATNALNDFLAYQPYQEYQNYCNMFAIAVPSKQKGSTHLEGGGHFVANATYFNSTYDVDYNYIITIPPYNVDTSASDGIGKANALLKFFGLATNQSLAVILVNEPYADGGSGGPIAISSTDINLEPEIIVHESGHTLGLLADEYTNGYADLKLNTAVLANFTQTTNQQTIKWNAWIPSGTPIPTEETDNQYTGVVGLFRGANYSTSDYRPALYCLMNNLIDPFVGGPQAFCPVCCEAMVEAIYKRARPVDSFTPATNATVLITNTRAVPFELTLLQPETHDLDVQWYTNGAPVPGGTNATYSLVPLSFTNGTYSVKALVNDPTPFVRTDPSNLLSASLVWTVKISVGILTIDSARWLPSGKFSFRLSGEAPNGFVIQSSTDLANWLSLSTNNLAAGQYYYTNSALAGTSCKFYRALLR